MPETTSKSALGLATAFGLARWQAGSQGYWLTSALEGSECFLEMNGPKRQTRQSLIQKTNCYCHGDHHILDHGNAAFCKLLCRMFSPATHSNDCPCTNFHQQRPSQNEIFFRKESARLSRRAKMWMPEHETNQNRTGICYQAIQKGLVIISRGRSVSLHEARTTIFALTWLTPLLLNPRKGKRETQRNSPELHPSAESII